VGCDKPIWRRKERNAIRIFGKSFWLQLLKSNLNSDPVKGGIVSRGCGLKVLNAESIAALMVDVVIPAEAKAVNMDACPSMCSPRRFFIPESSIFAGLASASCRPANPVYAASDGVMPTILRKPEERREFHRFK